MPETHSVNTFDGTEEEVICTPGKGRKRKGDPSEREKKKIKRHSMPSTGLEWRVSSVSYMYTNILANCTNDSDEEEQDY